MIDEDKKTYISAEGLERVKADLERMIKFERKEIANRIQEAKELGDLSENAEYSAAKEEQSFLEMRIAELEHTIKNAVIIEENSGLGGVIDVGTTVVFKDESDSKQEYQIVGSHESDPLNGKISNESPVGRAFLGKGKGDIVEFQAPKGIVKYKIIDIR